MAKGKSAGNKTPVKRADLHWPPGDGTPKGAAGKGKGKGAGGRGSMKVGNY